MSMSMRSPPPLEDHDDDGAPALDLLDEYWFFSNTLKKKKEKKKTAPQLPRSPSTGAGAGAAAGEKASGSAGPPPRLAGGRRLLRTPSLPTSRELPLPNNKAQRRQLAAAAADEVDDDDLNWSSIYEGVLRTRMAEGGGRSDHGDGPRLLRHSHSSTLAGGHTPPTATKPEYIRRMPSAVVARCSKNLQLQDNKCKSSSDLESMEVQGFRDLGFVFDKEELRADVLPGLKQHNQKQQQQQSPRRWQQVRRPALARAQSAAEIKDQLRMWAQAVACNVRQEC